MLPHSWEGTQRLELPVSRTTLNVWGGVPMVISEKSVQCQCWKSPKEEEGGSHWAFMKLETGTGWTPSVLATSDLNM